jgi:glycosyltransferase involved in cell wall biosynthesis
MRYVWDMYPDYIKTTGWGSRWLVRLLIHYLKQWDRLSADRVDHFIANSNFVAKRINKYYRRSAEVIHPPVDIEEFEVKAEKADYYLVLGQLTPYKRADLAVKAFIANGKKLVVIGDGEQYKALKALENERIKVLGRAEWSVCMTHLSNAKAVIFPGVEDFGMVPVEAMACGTPVLAYAKGGALETVIEGKSGMLFKEQTVESLNECIASFEAQDANLNVQDIRKQAEKFSKEKFKQKILAYIEGLEAGP